MRVQTRWSASIAFVVSMLLYSHSFADGLEEKLLAVDQMRAGFKTRFKEVDARCEALLEQYPQAEDQARIYFAWAHVEGQSGLQDPAKTLKHIKKALSLPLESEKRLQLLMYWGNALEVTHRGVRGDELKQVRPEVVTPYLKAIQESVRYIEETEAIPLPKEEKPGKERANNKVLTAYQAAKFDKEQKLERLLGFQTAFINQAAYIYSRMPFATEEIEELSTQHIADDVARERLMAKVFTEVNKRDERFRGETLKKPKKSEGLSSRAWLMIWFGNAAALLVLAGCVAWRKTKRTAAA